MLPAFSIASASRARVAVLLLLVAAAPAAATPPAPEVAFQDGHAWFVHARSGAVATAVACSGGAALQDVTVGFAGGTRTVASPAGACVTVQHAFQAPRPGLLAGYARATAADGLSATDAGSFDVQIVPFDTTMVAGFPPLASLAAPDPATPVYMEMLMRTDGSIRAYRVAFAGSIVADTISTTPAASTDKLVRIEFGTGASEAVVRVGGTVAWSGVVQQVDAQWWHVRPVAPTTA